MLIGGDGSDAQYVGAGGSSNPALPGAAACTIDGASELHCAGSLCIGGAGGQGLAGICAPFVSNGGQGASGGPGLLNLAAALVRVQDTVLQGGAGGAGGLGGSPCGTAAGPLGAPGAPSVGSVQALSGVARRLRTPNQVREQSSLPLEVVALPGEQIYLQLGVDTQWAYTPGLGGVRLVGNSSRRLFLGTVPSSGILVTALPIPDLGAGVEALWSHLQVFALDSAGAIWIGGSQELVALDSAF